VPEGRIEIRDRGGFFRTDYRLTVAGRDCSAMADKMGWQVDAVRAAMEASGVDPLPPITPVLCFLNVEWPLFRPGSFRGVRLESHQSVTRLMAKPSLLTAAQAERLVAVLAVALPSK
jgi:hypothetical protein